MAEMGHFTLPVGQDPETVTLSKFCYTNLCADKLGDVLLSQDENGPYMLYSGVEDEACIFNIVPICRVRKPLLSRLPAVYLDTSAVSYIRQDDSPEKTAATLKFWEAAQQNKFLLHLSDVTLEELTRCPEPKRTDMFDLLAKVPYTMIITVGSSEISAIAQDITGLGILPSKSVADVTHIAAAIYSRCDVITSWNFKHLANPATVSGVRTVALENCCGSIDILSPEHILEVYL